MKTMDSVGLKDIEELTFCSICKQKFNHLDAIPKLLPCRHYFCLSCVKSRMTKHNGVTCMYCWKKTDMNECDPITLPTYSAILALADNFTTIKISNENGRLTNGSGSPDIKKNDTCQLHAMPLSLWCQTCSVSACRACTSQIDHAHHGHQITSQMEITEKLSLEIQNESTSITNAISEVNRLMNNRRSFLLKVLEACVAIKTHIETEVQNSLSPITEIEEARSVINKTQASLVQIESVNEARHLYGNLAVEKQKVQLKLQTLYEQNRADFVVKSTQAILDIGMMKHVLENLISLDPNVVKQLTSNPSQSNNPILLLVNYCIWQMCNKPQLKTIQLSTTNNAMLLNQQQQTVVAHSANIDYVHQNGGTVQDYAAAVVGGGNNANNATSPTVTSASTAPTFASVSEGKSNINNGGQTSAGSGSINSVNSSSSASSSCSNNHTTKTLLQPQRSNASSSTTTTVVVGPSSTLSNQYHPIFYFNLNINGSAAGRILIETRPDVAPKMFKNFAALSTGELGYGYKGCNIFQCWEGESIITGDYEVNNGRGGRSIYDEAFFIPDDTKFPARRGAVGMRRTQKKHDSLGMVGSQFRITLQEMRGFTAIFGHVIEGIELVEKIASFGDQAGKPSKSVVIVSCGKLK